MIKKRLDNHWTGHETGHSIFSPIPHIMYVTEIISLRHKLFRLDLLNLADLLVSILTAIKNNKLLFEFTLHKLSTASVVPVTIYDYCTQFIPNIFKHYVK